MMNQHNRNQKKAKNDTHIVTLDIFYHINVAENVFNDVEIHSK